MQIQLFTNPEFGTIRMAGTNESPLFCLADICKAVELTNPSAVKTRLDEEDVQLIDLHALNSNEGVRVGNTKANFVTESGFYDVILQSSSPKVRPFRKWVTSEVLPSIRKTGGYIDAPKEASDEEIMARALIVAQRTIQNREQRIQMLEGEKEALEGENRELARRNDALAPKAQYVDDVLQSPNTYTFTQVAKECGFTSAQALIKRLMADGVFYRQSGTYLLTARMCGKGLTATRTARFFRSDGSPDTSTSTVFTEKGRLWVNSRYNLQAGRAAL